MLVLLHSSWCLIREEASKKVFMTLVTCLAKHFQQHAALQELVLQAVKDYPDALATWMNLDSCQCRLKWLWVKTLGYLRYPISYHFCDACHPTVVFKASKAGWSTDEDFEPLRRPNNSGVHPKAFPGRSRCSAG